MASNPPRAQQRPRCKCFKCTDRGRDVLGKLVGLRTWRNHQDADVARLRQWPQLHPELPVPSALQDAVDHSMLTYDDDSEADLASQGFPLPFDPYGDEQDYFPYAPDGPSEQRGRSDARNSEGSSRNSSSSSGRATGGSSCQGDHGLGQEEGLDIEGLDLEEEEDFDLLGNHNPGIGTGDGGEDDGSDSDASFDLAQEIGADLLAELIGEYILPQKPGNHPPPLVKLSKTQKLSLKHYRRWLRTHGTVEAYEQHAETIRELGHPVLSLYLVKNLVASFTEMRPRTVDMCVNSCIAYVGKYSSLDQCPWKRTVKDPKTGVKRIVECKELRYDRKGKARRLYRTLPILERLKAMYRNPTMSKLLRYRGERLTDLLKIRNSESQNWDNFVFKDTVDGFNNIRLSEKGLFKDPRDVALAIATDGAQLTANKDSSAWVITAACLNTPPEVRFQRAHQFVLAVVPGPNPPGDIESFFRPVVEELAQLNIGAWVWDGLAEEWFVLRVVLVGLYADQPGSTKLSKMTGTQGRRGCRFCMIHACYGHTRSRDQGEGAQSNENDARRDGDDRTRGGNEVNAGQDGQLGDEAQQGNGGQDGELGGEAQQSNAAASTPKAGKTPYFPLNTPSSLQNLPTNKDRDAKYDPDNLPLRSHAMFKTHIAQINSCRNPTALKATATQTGIAALPLLAYTPGFLHPD
ncbi:hypothetical protein CF326_g9019, partial [Tilletia indica]